MALAALFGGASADETACVPGPGSAVPVAAVHDGRTLRLADGTHLRLAGIEVGLPGEAHPREHAAREALAGLVGGRELTLRRLGTDRYGRTLAYAFLPAAEPNQPPVWIQHALVTQGHARVAARAGNSACAAKLLQAEAAARTARLGLWGEPAYLVRRAESPAEISAERGRFALVEGKVVSVRESGGTIYVNFGRRWSEDFTVTVPKRNERTFTAAGFDLKALTGRSVRVRGHVEERGGPWIEATRSRADRAARSGIEGADVAQGERKKS